MDDPGATADLLCELQGAWRSANLVYCPVTDDDVAFLDTLNADPVTFGMGGAALVRPQGKETAKGLAALLAKSYLAVMICLPAPAGINTTPTAAADDDKNDDPPPAPERIGYVALGLGGDHPTWPSNHNRSQALSITLAPAHQRRGHGTEALRWALRWAFRFGNLRRVELCVWEYNRPARAAYERVGFVAEGRQREVVFAGGRYWDLLLFSVLKREWLVENENK